MIAEVTMIAGPTGDYEITMVNTVTQDIWIATVGVTGNYNGQFELGSLTADVTSVVRASQSLINEYKLVDDMMKTDLIIHLADINAGVRQTIFDECGSTAGLGLQSCASLQRFIRGIPAISNLINAGLGRTLWRKIFGGKDLEVLIIFPGSSVVELELVIVSDVSVSFATESDSFVNSSGFAGGPGGLEGYNDYANGQSPYLGTTLNRSCDLFIFVARMNGVVIGVRFECY